MHLRLIEEIARNQWAITIPAFRSILAVVDGAALDEKQAAYLHSMSVDTKTEMVANFGDKIRDGWYASVLGNVGFIPVYGPTTPRAGVFGKASGVASYDALMSDFKMLESNRSVDTIALMFDTPGGAVTGNSDWADTIKNSSKRVVSYAWMAASAGYWAASASSEIYASETSKLGSIGTVATIMDTSEADKKRGVKHYEIVSSQSPLKRMAPDSPEVQAMIDEMADVFIRNVATNRNTTIDNVEQNYGRGAIVLGRRALEAGMIDGIMGVNDFVNMLVDNKNTSTFFVASARAGETTEGNDMDQQTVSNETPLTAENMREKYPSVVEAIEKAAVEAEHARIKTLEAMADQYKGQSHLVRDAVRAVIDTKKFDLNANVGTLGADVFSAANNALQAQLKNFGENHVDGTEAAGKASQAKPEALNKENEAKASEQRVAALAAAMKGAN